MLFMITSNSLPGKSIEVFKKAVERRTVSLKGIKVVGSWVYPGAGTAFIVCEANDIKALVEMTLPWRDLRQFEIVPVIETEELMKLVGSSK